MSLPTRNNPYSFDEFLSWRKGLDYYRDDEFFQRLLRRYCGSDWERIDEELRRMSPKVSYRWRDFAEKISWPENRPYVKHFDGHNHRIDRIVRPLETEVMEKEIFAEALFSKRTPLWLRLAKSYLIYQNGEACIACPIACTEGLVTLLERYADTDETRRILAHCTEGIDGDFGIAAQYVSEIQGGSDVPANVLEAVNEGGAWRLYGTKFFCSATHADYAAVTAKPTGSEEIALFVVPSWLPGNKEREIRNGFTIDRIKWKMGTTELTTGEITFTGALAYPVGPLNRGLANVVGIVLTYSRLAVGLSSGAFMARAVREAQGYARFREAFGMKIGDFPMVAGQLAEMELFSKRTVAGAFKLYRDFFALPGGLKGGLVTDETEEVKKQRFDIRELIMLQKITASKDSTDVLRQAMNVFGGHGVMEDFSSLPRLFRDSVVNELWEGPRNVLLTQIHRDFQRVWKWYRPSDFVKRVLAGADGALVKELGAEMDELVSYPSLFAKGDKTVEVCRRWDLLCERLFHAYQDTALAEVP